MSKTIRGKRVFVIYVLNGNFKTDSQTKKWVFPFWFSSITLPFRLKRTEQSILVRVTLNDLINSYLKRAIISCFGSKRKKFVNEFGCVLLIKNGMIFYYRKNQIKRVCQVPAEAVCSDVWAWRKYGQKPIKGSPYPRWVFNVSLIFQTKLAQKIIFLFGF